MAEVTMKFLGPKLHLKNDVFCDERLSEVMVLQQHCGGSTLCVFRELLPPNSEFLKMSIFHLYSHSLSLCCVLLVKICDL